MSRGRLILLTDLDDTLFASERSLPYDAARVNLAAVDGQGAPLSFQTHQQRALWELFSGAADLIIPVTGRTSYALDRVSLSFPGGYAVVSHGALVTYQGQVLPKWQRQLASQMEAAQLAMNRAYADLCEALPRNYPHLQFTLRLLEDLSVPVYLSIKAAETLTPETHELLSRIADSHELTLHANTRNAALRPPYTCKAAACRFLLEEVIELQPEDTLIALGDSLSDLPFMAMSDVAVMPTRSQLWNSVKDLAQ